MTQSRNNHYVPRWYQEGFIESGRRTLAYLDLTPPSNTLRDGRIIVERARFESPTSRCFVQRDLYSTFFGATVNDEIERRLFGAIDARGAPAVKAFIGTDAAEWHRHFESLFSFMDIQKVRTPKGLDWLRGQYPMLTQNELMEEMQGIQMMNCTIWTEGVREIVSSEDSEVKFIVTDHPVTTYNPAIEPNKPGVVGHHDPSIALKGSQTIFPLNRDYCLILTNLECAKEPDTNPLEKRTFARNYKNSLARTDAFIRSRKLNTDQVSQINAILKAQSRRYIAAGREEWLYPELKVSGAWPVLGTVLRPPKEKLWSFGGELYVSFNDGRVHYQDEFGRTQKPLEPLQKTPPAKLRGGDSCGCGSDQPFKVCCEARPTALRPSWTELSIRERNMALYRAAVEILGVTREKSWVEVRAELTDEKISHLYSVFAAFWPLETDLLSLLPKPDGRSRAVYTGALHPELINEFAIGTCLYFGEVIIEHPFLHAGVMQRDYSPVETPRAFRQEVLRAVLLLFTLAPLVDCGLVNLVPDLGIFDRHLREQTLRMATQRAARPRTPADKDERILKVMEADMRRNLLLLPPEVLARKFSEAGPGLQGLTLKDLLQSAAVMRRQDPLVSLQPDSLGGGEAGGQIAIMRLAPNFEMAMYLAQATGACIITDSLDRWSELKSAMLRRWTSPHGGAPALAREIESAVFAFPHNELDVARLAYDNNLAAYPDLMSDTSKYLIRRQQRGAKPNFEAQLAARFTKAHAAARAVIEKSGVAVSYGRLHAALPAQVIQDNTVNRLLLMSSSEHHLPGVPMAFWVERREHA